MSKSLDPKGKATRYQGCEGFERTTSLGSRFRFSDNGKHYLLVTRADGGHLVYVNVSRKGVRWSAGAVPIEDTDRLINLGLFKRSNQ